MATARVSRERLLEGRLPPVCVKTGTPADGTVTATFSYLPPWTFLLLLAGIFPFFIALMFAEEKIVAQLPLRTAVHHRHRQLTRRAWAFFGVAVVCGTAAAVSALGWLWWGAAAAFVAVVVTLVQRGSGWVEARPVRGTTLVALRRVSSEFATAVEHERTAH